MHRNFDLVITLMVELREASSRSLTSDELAEAVRSVLGETSSEELAHHVDLLHDAELIKPLGGGWRLSWQGYDALEQEEDDEDEEDEFND